LLAHGLPVIATRPEPPEPALTDGGLLRLVGRRDAPGLASTLLGLLADASGRARLGEAGRAYTRDLSWPTIAERHVEVYESVLEERLSARGTGPARRAGAPSASALTDEALPGSGTGGFPGPENG
jgi:hypothetical protein